LTGRCARRLLLDALAILTGEPLLFKGDDFVHTDVATVAFDAPDLVVNRRLCIPLPRSLVSGAHPPDAPRSNPPDAQNA
jgi:hypothetical protein